MSPILPLVLAAAAAATAATATRSVWEGVYSVEQAARGKQAYLSQCVICHGETLLGGEDTRPLVDKEFLDLWNGKTMGELVEATRKSMPKFNPGSLSRRQTTDMIAYILSENGFPAGEHELKSSLTILNQITIEPKP